MAIQILPSNVVDQIAAGEVVERPAHLVKELVENSIDANSTKISVEMAGGGRSIKVNDDGSGIHSGELSLALQRFATSKIKSSDDLWSLRSFGFRGEALASIASVSKLQLISRTEDRDRGSLVESNFGKLSEVLETSHAKGTTIKVDELFENIPARLKFLKTPAAEHQQIKNVLRALALTHNTVEMKIFEEGRLWALWGKTENRLERAKQVLEADHLFSTSMTKDGVKVEVVFSDPHHVQKTSKQIWIFAQNRWVQDRSLQMAVMESYRNLLMHGEFPTCCVWVDVDPGQIDINIHPAKSAVKFVEPSRIFKAVYACLRSALEQAPWLQIALGQEIEAAEQMNYATSPTEVHPQQTLFAAPMAAFAKVQVKQKVGLEDFKSLGERKFDYQAETTAIEPGMDLGTSTVLTPEVFINAEPPVSEKGYWSSLQVVGQVGLTYLVCEGRDGLVFVDQHAAHERVMFEKLMDSWQKNSFTIQNFLIPLAIDLSADQVEMIEKHLQEFSRFGLEVEILGPQTVGVLGAPAGIQEKAIHEVVRKTAEELVDYGGSYAFEKNLSEILSTMACHSAVRAGQALSQDEMRELLKEMDAFPLSSFCPHGRPVSVTYPFSEVEKDFGRRV